MINIAAFVDVKNGQLSTRSSQLLLLVQAMQRINPEIKGIHIYTLDSVNNLEIPSLPGAQLVAVAGLSESFIFSTSQLQSLVAKLISDQINCVLGYKNLITDQIFPAISAQMKLPLVGQVLSLGLSESSIELKQSIFSGKAMSTVTMNYACLLSFNNAFEFGTSEQAFESISSVTFSLDVTSSYQLSSLHKASVGLNLADASYVVGAGRGLKDPKNWTIIEDLATKIGAATACSKPVSDIDWRPHSEHVGQTGIKIAPKLYIACGISGAIQHLAGVNGSKTIVVINNDPEAPFFKYADYGIVGDVFDVLPELVKNL